VLVDVYDFHLPLADAVAAPRYHHQLLPADTIFTEPFAPAPETLKQGLEHLGYRVEPQDFNGDIAAIEIEKSAPQVAPDPRARGVGLIVKP
jgi:gamma-glutamyltranspeptidase / glutathione hydrolase